MNSLEHGLEVSEAQGKSYRNNTLSTKLNKYKKQKLWLIIGFVYPYYLEELVRLNLRIKTTTVSFVNGDCTTHRQMEQLNSDIRNYLEKMRRTLDRLRHLAERQSSSESRKMLLSDVDKYADQLAACHRSFRQANLRYE